MTPHNWLGDLHLFVAVARARSFTRAAAALDMPRSTLSRRLDELEKAIGIRLLNRTTRRVELTEYGASYLVRAERLVEEARIAHEDLCDRADRPIGLVRVSIPASIVWRLAAPWIAEFLDLYPEIRIEIDTSPDHVDPIADRWDVCIYDSPVPDSSLTVRRLAEFPRALFCSPDYAAAHGLPDHPDELNTHECICAGLAPGRSTWRLQRGLERIAVSVAGRLACGNAEFSPLFAIEGAGIAAGVTTSYAHLVGKGLLTPVLADWQFEPLVVSAIMPHRMMPAKTRIFLNFIAAKMKDAIVRIERAEPMLVYATGERH